MRIQPRNSMNPNALQPISPWGVAAFPQQPVGASAFQGGATAPNILQSTGSFSPQFGEPAVHPPLPEILPSLSQELSSTAENLAAHSTPSVTSPLLASEPVDSFASEKPVLAKNITQKTITNDDSDRMGMYIFRAVKLGLGGVAIAYFSSKFANVKFSKVFCVELATGLAELFMTQKILNAKGPLTQKIMEVSNRLVKGPDKPVQEMTPAEKHNSFVPISTLVTVLSGLVSGFYSYFARDTIDFAKESARLESLKAARKEIKPLLEQLKNSAEIAGREVLKFAPIHYLRKNPLFIIPISVTAAGVYGFMEGTIAQYLIQLYKNMTGQTVDPELLVD